MRPPVVLATLVFGLAVPPALAGQATADEARLVFSVGIGQTSGGGTLWAVGKQPLIVDASTIDTLAVSRGFRRNLTAVFSGTYFPGSHLGLNAEAQLLGLGSVDKCSVFTGQGGSLTPEVCNSIDGHKRSATSVALSVGALYRVGSTQPIHPYGRANFGLVISEQSFTKMAGRHTTSLGEAAVLVLYDDPQTNTVQPFVSFGGGVVAVIGRGYQLRFEVRDNWVRVPAITEATVRQGLVPDTHTVGKHLLSFILAFDVVLERKRGRRY
jgi:hypothetical protein